MAFSLNMGLDGVFGASLNTNGNNINMNFGDNWYYSSQHSLLMKERWLAYNALYKNIGNREYKPTTFGTVIGYPSIIQYGNKWAFYNTDKKRTNSSDYIEYVNQNFFNEKSAFPNGFLDNTERLETLMPQNLILENNHIGAIHYYNWETSNPNNGDNGDADTYLGTWNTRFLNNALNATLLNDKNLKRYKNRISSTVYDGLGLLGDKLGTLARTDGNLFNGKAHRIKKSVFSFDSELIKDFGEGLQPTDASEKKLYESLSETTRVYINASRKGRNLDNLQEKDFKDVDFYRPMDYLQRFVRQKFRKLKDTSNQATNDRPYRLSGMIDNYNEEGVNALDDLNVLSAKLEEGEIAFTYEFRTLKAKSQKDGQDVLVNVAFDFGNIGNSLFRGNALYAYAENSRTGGTVSQFNEEEYDDTIGVIESGFYPIVNEGDTQNYNDIIHFTNRQFLGGYYDTLVARFATEEGGAEVRRTDTQTAVTERWGMSHGRNLLKRRNKRSEKTNGYANPYCRVWTYHHQYNAYNRLIRPFVDGNDTEDELLLNNEGYKTDRTAKGLERFKKYGTRDRKTGLVRIAPTNETLKSQEEIKKLMFSIENLAWKADSTALNNRSIEKGPHNGRIMWFPPYNLKFDENVDVRWNATSFIGRGEDIYTYTGAERSGSLSFTVLIDHPTIINQWRGMTSSDDSVNDSEGDSIEQGILRFFAGCDVLNPKLPPKPEPVPPTEPNEEVKPTPPPKPEENPTPPIPINDEFVFNVYFPNNYTGFDDLKGKTIKPIEYLLNGVGAQTQLVDGKVEDLPTLMDQKYLGYEVGDDGISKAFNLNGITISENRIPCEQLSSSTIPNVTLVTQLSSKPRKCDSKYNNWGYRVDTTTKSTNACGKETNVSQEILRQMNYLDSASFKLNASGYESAYTTGGFTEKPKELYSLADVYCALNGVPSIWSSEVYTQSNVDKLKELLNDPNVTVTEIDYIGNASSDGYGNVNEALSSQRANTIRKWFESCNVIKNKFSTDVKHNVTFNGSKKDRHSGTDISVLLSKVWRSTTVKVKYSKMNISDANTNTNTSDTSVDLVSEEVVNEIVSNTNQITEVSEILQINSETEATQRYDEMEDTLTDRLRQSYKDYDNDFEGYGNEYKFFSELASSDSIFRNKIVEKIKYFDPAFHSISPEGFNSRLTFLHQCTRAGNTTSFSDLNGQGNATNLAFGTPPVCVLKIGDFIHTKIIINTLNINYDDSSWDLNSEGIGVMPMMANVNMSFKYIGSQSLSGPISRLGNALSFNYYANTELYDGRSEIES